MTLLERPTEAPVRMECPTCGHIEIPRLLRPPHIVLATVTEAEIDRALSHNYHRKRTAEGLARHMSDPNQRAQTRYNIALGKALGTYPKDMRSVKIEGPKEVAGRRANVPDRGNDTLEVPMHE